MFNRDTLTRRRTKKLLAGVNVAPALAAAGQPNLEGLRVTSTAPTTADTSTDAAQPPRLGRSKRAVDWSSEPTLSSRASKLLIATRCLWRDE